MGENFRRDQWAGKDGHQLSCHPWRLDPLEASLQLCFWWSASKPK